MTVKPALAFILSCVWVHLKNARSVFTLLALFWSLTIPEGKYLAV